MLQAMQRHSLFHRIEVFTLDVLNKRHGDGCFIGYVTDQRRNPIQLRQLTRAPATFTGDNFETISLPRQRAHNNRLHQALRLNRGGQFFKRFWLDITAWLIAARLNPLDRKVAQLTLCSRAARW